MKLTNCKNCGAALVFGHCDYCGTDYEQQFMKIEPIVIREAKAKIVQASLLVDKEALLFSDYIDYIYKDLARKLAEFILENDCMDIKQVYDPCFNQVKFNARCRIIPNNIKL